jgi:hypothetical protein
MAGLIACVMGNFTLRSPPSLARGQLHTRQYRRRAHIRDIIANGSMSDAAGSASAMASGAVRG